MTDKEQEEKDLTAEERTQWLKDRGVLIETPEDRKAAAAAPSQPSSGDPVTYVYIPADKAKPLQDCTFVPPATQSQVGPDALSEYLKPAFATNANKIDISLFQQQQDANPVQQLGTGDAAPKVSTETLQKVAKQGHVETFTLVNPTPGNQFTAVTLYLDEVGQMKRLPLNSRASDLAKVAGYNPPPIFYGDMFIARTQRSVKAGVKTEYVDIKAEDCNANALWLQQASVQNLEHQMQFNQLTGKQGEMQPTVAGSDGVAKKEEGYSWTQSEEEVELIVPLSSTAITSKDIAVDFKPRKVVVKLKNGSKDTLVTVDLFERVDCDGCTWTIDKGATNSVVVTLEKADEALWPRLEN